MSGSYAIRDKCSDPRLFSRSICKSNIDTPGLFEIFVQSGPFSFHHNFFDLYNAQVRDQWSHAIPSLPSPFPENESSGVVHLWCLFRLWLSPLWSAPVGTTLLRSGSSPATVHRRAWIWSLQINLSWNLRSNIREDDRARSSSPVPVAKSQH